MASERWTAHCPIGHTILTPVHRGEVACWICGLPMVYTPVVMEDPRG